MSTPLKPIHLWGLAGPNPPKVAIFLEELSIPYEVDPIKISQVKEPHFLAVNPNGRLPAIRDPNTGITLWESGAIVEYLIERYDTKHELSFAPGTEEYYHAKQWLFFQTTGQAPYFGQLAWFKRYAPEKIPMAIERYAKEIHRVTSVLEGWLGGQKEKYSEGDGPWLVGNKLSYADISFFTWYWTIEALAKEEFDIKGYPLVNEWLEKMKARKSVVTVTEEVQRRRATGQH